MKKTLFLLLFTMCNIVAFSQAKKPILMVVPSDVWCYTNNYMISVDNQGVKEKYPNYEQALQTNSDLNLVISKIGELMAERGFPLKDLSSSLKSIKQDDIENSLLSSKSGDVISESPMDKLLKVAKADIVLQVSWKINNMGPKRSLTFNLQGLDAYTNKQIAAASGTGAQSSATELPILLEEAVLLHIDRFNDQLQSHFDDLFANGREIKIDIKRWSNSPVDFESEFDGDELGTIIEDWVAENTVEGRFSTQTYSANRLVLEQVRIPMVDKSGRAVDPRRWASELTKHLKKNYNLTCKLQTKGLGSINIIVGEK